MGIAEQFDLELPDSPEYRAHLALMNLITGNPLIRSAVPPNQLFFYEGNPFDDYLPANLPRPFIRCRPIPDESKWFTEGQHRFPMQWFVELGINGWRVRSLMNLWHAVRLAVSPNRMMPDGSEHVRDYLIKNGISNIEFNKTAYEIVNAGTGANQFLYGQGIMTVQLFINT